ncbi:hypothetical protein [Couchioplanes azureus]|uniref:hypothetical protein n=1 Tax=Couchioplanes caeruleus TaxID=56438 RepID=UPI0016701C22|nr:hypothetical protein [Couchioplanes caeruleus]
MPDDDKGITPPRERNAITKPDKDVIKKESENTDGGGSNDGSGATERDTGEQMVNRGDATRRDAVCRTMPGGPVGGMQDAGGATMPGDPAGGMQDAGGATMPGDPAGGMQDAGGATMPGDPAGGMQDAGGATMPGDPAGGMQNTGC